MNCTGVMHASTDAGQLTGECAVYSQAFSHLRAVLQPLKHASSPYSSLPQCLVSSTCCLIGYSVSRVRTLTFIPPTASCHLTYFPLVVFCIIEATVQDSSKILYTVGLFSNLLPQKYKNPQRIFLKLSNYARHQRRPTTTSFSAKHIMEQIKDSSKLVIEVLRNRIHCPTWLIINFVINIWSFWSFNTYLRFMQLH